MVRILIEAVSCSFDFAGEKKRRHCVAQCPLYQDKLQSAKAIYYAFVVSQLKLTQNRPEFNMKMDLF
jgi:hypothetical protein